MIKVGIDIGGTFTDSIALDDATGEFWTAKVPTTYPDPASGFLQALGRLTEKRNLHIRDVELLIHGTTLVTNAIIERRGGPVGLLATEGFGDALWIRTERRYDLFDVMIEFPEPLVPRRRVVEVPERMRYDGKVLRPLDEKAVAEGVDRLAEAGVNAIAVCLLHSYANPTHEQRIAEIARERHPEIPVSLSSEVWPKSGEYERMSTTVANAYVQPVTRAYLDRIEKTLADNGFRGKLYLMLSNGGTAAVETGRQLPVQLVESGPAAGVLAAQYLAQQAGITDCLSFDMGGTTAKLSLIEGGKPLQSDLVEAARLKRHLPGSGIPIKVPVVDLLEIGSGGGSIANIDHMGLLKVGPHSAGSAPGPACYGWSGDQPTVTDADLVLGYLNPNYFLGGEMTLDAQAARRAIDERIGQPTGLELAEAAWGIHEVVNQNMALAAKMHVLERGHDPTRYALVAYGGAGPVHAYGVARTLGLQQVIIPPSAGVAASLGFLVAPIAFDLVRSFRLPLPGCDWEALQAAFLEMERHGAAILRDADVPEDAVRYTLQADMRYIGQGFEVTVPMPQGQLDGDRAGEILATFQETYRERYAHLPTEEDKIEFVCLRVRAWTPVVPPRLPVAEERGRMAEPVDHRPVYFGESGGYVSTPVYRWDQMVPNVPIPGPAIVEAPDTSAVVGPSATATMDRVCYLTLRLKTGGA